MNSLKTFPLSTFRICLELLGKMGNLTGAQDKPPAVTWHVTKFRQMLTMQPSNVWDVSMIPYNTKLLNIQCNSNNKPWITIKNNSMYLSVLWGYTVQPKNIQLKVNCAAPLSFYWVFCKVLKYHEGRNVFNSRGGKSSEFLLSFSNCRYFADTAKSWESMEEKLTCPNDIQKTGYSSLAPFDNYNISFCRGH